MQPKKKDASTWIARKGLPGFPIDCAPCSLERVGGGGVPAFSRLLHTEPGVLSSSKRNLPLSNEKIQAGTENFSSVNYQALPMSKKRVFGKTSASYIFHGVLPPIPLKVS